MAVPLIDFESYDEANPETLTDLGRKISTALTDIGFMSVSNLGIEQEMLDQVFAASRRFFSSDAETKLKSGYVSASENFGYQGLCKEHLDPSKPADLKETFTMRNLLQHSADDERWPSPEFRDLMTGFYKACLEGAYRMQQVLANALDVEADFFIRHHNGENVTLRLLYYPPAGADDIAESQLGAGAHTDYGLLTLLFQDNVGGLEVQDMKGQWLPVDYIPSAIVINSGDLLERWTNGRYRSTLHRAQPQTGGRARFSIAMFVDPDSETPVSVLESCITKGEPAKYPPITAGEHVQQRIEASHKAMFAP